MSEKVFITRSGFQNIKAKATDIKDVQLVNATNELEVARDFGDLSENSAYHAAKEKLRLLNIELSSLANVIQNAEIVDISSMSGDVIKFGATVKLEDCDSGKFVIYKITSEYEADADNGSISYTSPVARSLIGKKKGDDVEIRTPGGVKDYEVLEVEFK